MMLSTAPCSVCDTIDMACVACADQLMAGYREFVWWETAIKCAQMSRKCRSEGIRKEKESKSIVVASTSKSRNIWCFQRVADVPARRSLGRRTHRIDVKNSLAEQQPHHNTSLQLPPQACIQDPYAPVDPEFKSTWK